MIHPALIRDCIRIAFPDLEISATSLLSGGLINTNIKVEFGSLREPYISRAFVESGGFLPDDWRRVTRVLDLTALGFA